VIALTTGALATLLLAARRIRRRAKRR